MVYRSAEIELEIYEFQILDLRLSVDATAVEYGYWRTPDLCDFCHSRVKDVSLKIN